MTTLGVLSPAQRESFETHGLLRIPRALDDHTVATLRNICLRLRYEDKQLPQLRPAADESWRDQFDLPFNEKQAACDQARWEATNIVARERAFLDLIDHREVLPAVADLLGDNIFLMSSRAMIRDRVPMSEREFAEFPLDWHRDLGISVVEMHEPHPRLSIKVAYWLTSLNAPGQGAMQVVPAGLRHVWEMTV